MREKNNVFKFEIVCAQCVCVYKCNVYKIIFEFENFEV